MPTVTLPEFLNMTHATQKPLYNESSFVCAIIAHINIGRIALKE